MDRFKRETRSSRRKCSFRVAITLGALMSFFPLATTAQECASDDDDDGRKWMLMIGAGAGLSPNFEGSNLHNLGAFPLIAGEYRWTAAKVYIEGEELAVTVRAFRDIPISLSMGVALGDSRNAGVDSALTGSHSIANPIRGLARVSLGEDTISVNAQTRYVPFSADGGALSNAFLYDLYLESEIMAIPFVIMPKTGITFMDATFASALYDTTPAAMHGAFSAGAGLRSADASVDVLFFLSENWGFYANGEISFLLGSAAESPISVTDLLATARLAAFLKF